MITYDLERRQYVIYFFMPAWASRLAVEVTEDGTIFRWRSEGSSAMGNWRGEKSRVNDNDYNETVEMEMQPGTWVQVCRQSLRRVPLSDR